MGIADDIISRTDQLASDRSQWEVEWRSLADYCLPVASMGMQTMGAGRTYDRLIDAPSSREASRRRYDSTAMWAIDRLASGMESLVTPQSEKWHGLATEDVFAPEPTDEETEWFEALRDYLFTVRYDARSGFAVANQKAIRSAVTFGTAVIFCEEAFGSRDRDQKQLPILYRHIPISQAYLAVNAQGEPDTNHRRFTMTARQMVQKFGEKCSQKVREAAENDRQKDQRFGVIHAVFPREEIGSRANIARKAAFTSFYIEAETKTLLGESGFYEFPYIVYYWLQGEEAAYGESPAMLALDDIRGLNVMRKTGLSAAQQWVKPPIAVSHDGVMNRPNLNPGAVNYGAIDAQGRQKIQPLLTAQNPNVMESILEGERNQVREHLYVNLFQILIQNPQMTATEAMLRSNEKGELLGPSGAKIQAGLSRMIEREIGILDRKGAFMPGAALQPPESLAGRSYGTRFTSPLDRLRRTAELVGVQRTLELALPLAQADQGVLDNFDFDAIIELSRDVNGAPKRIMRTQAEVAEMRQQRAQAQQAMQTAAMAKEGAGAVKEGAEAVNEAAPAAQNLQALAGMMGMGGEAA